MTVQYIICNRLKNKTLNFISKILFKITKRKLLKHSTIGHLLIDKEKKYGGNELVVSLTSYNKRINSVYLTIESIAMQTAKANRIILWLDKDEISEEQLPLELKKQMSRGLEIKFYHNIRSYKKLIPTLINCKNSDVITIDDDILYPEDMISNFVSNIADNPGVILCNRSHKMRVSLKGELLPYLDWDFCSGSKEVSKYIFPTGVGGVYYPVGSLNYNVTREDLFVSLCPSADDVWFKFMSYLNGTKVKNIHNSKYFELNFLSDDSVQDIALSNINNSNSINMNDIQIKKVLDEFKIKKI